MYIESQANAINAPADAALLSTNAIVVFGKFKSVVLIVNSYIVLPANEAFTIAIA